MKMHVKGLSVLRGLGTLAIATLATLAAAPASQALDYPQDPVKIVVPVAPGGPMDMIARLVADELTERWGETFVVENRPGGGQVIATNAVATAEPDGYTLLLMGHVHTMNPWLFETLPYKPDALKPVTMLTETPLIMSVNPDLPLNSVQDVIDYAKAHPGELRFGSSGPSSSLRFAGELLQFMTDTEMTHVPYKGNGPMTVALTAGEVDLGFVNPVSLPYIEDGRIRALAITSAKRSPRLPDLPTVGESGVPGYVAGSWFGLMAPSGTPDEIVQKLNAEINDILDSQEVLDRLASVEATAAGDTTDEFQAVIDQELEKWRKLIEKTGISIN